MTVPCTKTNLKDLRNEKQKNDDRLNSFNPFIGNYFRMTSTASIRTVEFLSILLMGVLAGVLFAQLFKKLIR